MLELPKIRPCLKILQEPLHMRILWGEGPQRERENAVEQHQDVPYAEIIIQHGAKTAHTTKGKDWQSSLKLKKKFPSTQRGIWLQHKCNSLIQSSKAEIGLREEITMQANR